MQTFYLISQNVFHYATNTKNRDWQRLHHRLHWRTLRRSSTDPLVSCGSPSLDFTARHRHDHHMPLLLKVDELPQYFPQVSAYVDIFLLLLLLIVMIMLMTTTTCYKGKPLNAKLNLVNPLMRSLCISGQQMVDATNCPQL